MTTTNKQLRRAIMRRVYYAYGISLMVHPMLWHGIALSISVALFGKLVHVAMLIHNLLEIKVSAVPQFVLNAFMRGEVLTIAVVGVMVFTLLSVQWQFIRLPRVHRVLQPSHF